MTPLDAAAAARSRLISPRQELILDALMEAYPGGVSFEDLKNRSRLATDTVEVDQDAATITALASVRRAVRPLGAGVTRIPNNPSPHRRIFLNNGQESYRKRARNEKNARSIGIRLYHEQIAELDHLAERRDVSRCRVIADLLQDGLERERSQE